MNARTPDQFADEAARDEAIERRAIGLVFANRAAIKAGDAQMIDSCVDSVMTLLEDYDAFKALVRRLVLAGSDALIADVMFDAAEVDAIKEIEAVERNSSSPEGRFQQARMSAYDRCSA